MDKLSTFSCNDSAVDFTRYRNLTKRKEVAGDVCSDTTKEEGKIQLILTQVKEGQAGQEIKFVGRLMTEEEYRWQFKKMPLITNTSMSDN